MIKLISAFMVLLLATPFSSKACSCISGTIRESVQSVPVVAGIEVLRIDTVQIQVDSRSRSFIPYAKYTVRVIEQFKALKAGDTISIYSSFSDCGYHFKAGMKYIVFAHLARFKHSGNDKLFETINCYYNSTFNEVRAREIKNEISAVIIKMN